MREASGKFVIRLPAELHERLRALSRERQISLNQLCTAGLAALNNGDQKSQNSTLSEEFIQRLQSKFARLGAIVLFGSTARGEQSASSDTDLLLVLSPGSEISRELYHRWDEVSAAFLSQNESQRVMVKKLSPHFVALPHSPLAAGSLWFEVALDGKILWEKQEANTSRFLYQIREAMASGQIQRQLTHGHPYWVRKHPYEK